MGARNLVAMGLLAGGLPLFAWQAWRLWRDTPRLPEAPGARSGRAPGAEPALSLVVIGESPAAGVGVAHQDLALAPSLARVLRERSGRAVDWRVHARNGATARAALGELVPGIAPDSADLVVVALGANDLLSLRTPGRWGRDLGTLLDALRARLPRARLLVSAVPPVGRFPRIARPLRDVLGLRARDFDAQARQEAQRRAQARFCELPFEGGAEFFCEDGFHPSALGQRRWAEGLAGAAGLLSPAAAGT